MTTRRKKPTAKPPAKPAAKPATPPKPTAKAKPEPTKKPSLSARILQIMCEDEATTNDALLAILRKEYPEGFNEETAYSYRTWNLQVIRCLKELGRLKAAP